MILVLSSSNTVEDNKIEISENVWPIAYFYNNVKMAFHLSDRMVRTYISMGLIPPPDRRGKRAFYDLNKSKVLDFLEVVRRLQNLYRLSLADIKALIDKYRDQIVDLNEKLESLEIMSNRTGPTASSMVSPIGYIMVSKRFLERISNDVLYLKKLDIKDI